MAERSKRDKTDGGWHTRPVYEKWHSDGLRQAPNLGIFGGSAQLGSLAEGEPFFAHLFQVSSDGVVLYEVLPAPQAGRFIDVNERMCQILGYPREELLKLNPLEVFDEEAKRMVPALGRELQKSSRAHFEITLVRKDGQRVPVEVSVNVLPVQERRITLSVVRDVTEWRRIEDTSFHWKQRLEEEIRAQTEEAREIIDRLQDEVARRVLAEGELRRYARQMQRLALELSETEERERKRIADLLHDDLQQTLAAAKFQLSILSVRVRSDNELAEVVGQIKEMLKEAIDKSRNLSHELGPAVLSQSSLDDAFEWLARQMESKHGLTVHVKTRGRTDCSSGPIRAFLYKAARELLFNVVKHAKVSEATLRLQRVRSQLRLTISDKGQGFDPQSLVETSGFGLLSVRERVQFLGGRMKIKSAAGKGSTFLIAVPDAGVPLVPA